MYLFFFPEAVFNRDPGKHVKSRKKRNKTIFTGDWYKQEITLKYHSLPTRRSSTIFFGHGHIIIYENDEVSTN